MEENITLSQLLNHTKIILTKATNTISEIFNTDAISEPIDITLELGSDLASAIKGLNLIKTVASIPSKIFMRKYEKFCRDLIEIPIEKRQKYIEKLGQSNFNKEGVFLLNIINRIEDEDKLPFLVKLLEARMDNIISANEYRRLTILIDRTFYSDLLYLEHNITEDPVSIQTDSDFGLVASGLLVTAGNDWSDPTNPNDTGIRFNYTSAAKKLAQILFGVTCDINPSNKGISIIGDISEEEIIQMVNK